MTNKETDAVEVLIAQHREMEHLLALVRNAETGVAKKALFIKAADLLTVHIKSEEEVFYPAVHQARTEDDLLEALEEHLSLKRLLKDLLDIDPVEKAFEAKFKVLKEQAEHHHHEEEQHLFPAVRKLLDADQRASLGSDMLTAQADLAQRGAPRGTVKNETASAAPLE